MPLEDLGRLILQKRTKLGLGIRAAAREVGVSHATLARVEKGFLPDLEHANDPSIPQVHFRRGKTATPATAAALARMILTAQAAWRKSDT
jgi:DNA-binding XRE family transcriptional regulator